MPVCQNCNTKWTYKETLIKLLSFKKEMECNYCDSNQYITKDSIFTLCFYFAPLLILEGIAFSYFSQTYPSFFVFITVLILFLSIFSLVSPKVVQLSDEEEKSWW